MPSSDRSDSSVPALNNSWGGTFLCFVLALSLYVWTAARTVQGGDAGEFGLIGILGGIAHPPGYPLYSLLARLAGVLPFGPPFYRVALASAVCGAASVALVRRVTWRWSGHRFASIATALVYATAPLSWRLAGIPEVFTLHALLVAALLLAALRLVESAPD